MKRLVVSSADEIPRLKGLIGQSAEVAMARLSEINEARTPLGALSAVKFEQVGADPLDPLRPLNLIEQVNQCFTYLVSLAAVEALFELHPDAGPFKLNLGNVSGSDVESLDRSVIAEVFAAVRPSNNRKLKNDIERAAKTEADAKYVFFHAPGEHEPFEEQGVRVVPLPLDLGHEVGLDEPYDWRGLGTLQVGLLGEHLVWFEFARRGLNVYTPAVDDHGVDFLVAMPAGRLASVQVKTSRDFSYVFLRKDRFQLEPDAFLALVVLVQQEAPRLYLIPSQAWETPEDPFVSRDFVGKKSPPEWGVKLSRQALPALAGFEFRSRLAATIGAS